MHTRHVYLHVPFCARRCSYCDFAIAVRSRVPVAEYVSALRAELSIRFSREPAEPVDTIYLGGGTPSLLGPSGVTEVLSLVAKRFPPVHDAEVTLEANPDDVSRASVAAWQRAGVNRVSLGAQSFDPGALAWMHRTHGAEQIDEAARALREEGMENWSLDLIFSLPETLGRSWEADLARAIALGPAHVSLYGLTVEPRTPLARWRDRGRTVEGDEDAYEREYLLAHRLLTDAGFDHYEVSNFGRPGFSSQHNRGYWTGASYVGLGPAAHGFDGAVRRWNDPVYASWVRRVGGGRDPLSGQETLTNENRAAEQVYLGLRTIEGLPLGPGDRASVQPWITAGWATLDRATVRLTPTGWLRLDSLAASLTVVRSR